MTRPKLTSIRNSTIGDNTTRASSVTGSTQLQGAGIFNDGLLELINDQVTNNSGTVTGPSDEAQGGGAFNGDQFTWPPVELVLQNTNVTHNSLYGSVGSTLQGGGLYTAPPATVSITHSLIALNMPDQCFGC
jgi:hypothetical protein